MYFVNVEYVVMNILFLYFVIVGLRNRSPMATNVVLVVVVTVLVVIRFSMY